MAITIIIIIAVLVVTTHPSLLYASGVPLDRLETQGGAHSWLPSSLRIDDSHHRCCWCWGCVAMIILMAITITIVVITRPGLCTYASSVLLDCVVIVMIAIITAADAGGA